jgi:hypothetical protein
MTATAHAGTMYQVNQGGPLSLRLSYGLLVLAAVFMGLSAFAVPVLDHHKLTAGLFAWSLAWMLQRLVRQTRETLADLLSFVAQMGAAVFFCCSVLTIRIGHLALAKNLELGLLCWGAFILLAVVDRDPIGIFSELPPGMAISRLLSNLGFIIGVALLACALFGVAIGGLNIVYAGLFAWAVAAVLREVERHLRLRSFVALGGSISGDLLTFAAWTFGAVFLGLSLSSVQVGELHSGGAFDAGLFAWSIAYLIAPLERFHWPSALQLPNGTFLETPGDPQLYWIQNATRRPISDATASEVKTGLGNIWLVWPSYLQQIPLGQPIELAQTRLA